MDNGKRAWLAVLDGDSNPRLGLRSEFKEIEEEIGFFQRNCRWDGAMNTAYLGS